MRFKRFKGSYASGGSRLKRLTKKLAKPYEPLNLQTSAQAEP
jgi:hypothetical protein